MFSKFQKMLGNKKGFSLIELIVVIAIIGILVMLAAPRFLGYTKDAQVAGMQSDAKILSDAAVLYNIDNPGQWPTTGDVLADKAVLTELGEDVEVFAIDEAELNDYVKNLKNPVSEYGLVTEGKFEGEVFHLEGLVKKDETTWFGTSDISE